MSSYGTSEGRIERFFSRPDDSYVIATLTSGVTIKFDSPQSLFLGNSIRALGTWREHPKYGRQLHCYGFVYLDESELTKDQKALQTSLQFVFEKLKLKIRGGEIIKRYGALSKSTIEENPYLLAREVPGFGLDGADEVAAALGIPRSDPRRIECAIEQIVDVSCQFRGNCFLPEPLLLERAASELQLSLEEVDASVQRLSRPMEGPLGITPPRLAIEAVSEDLQLVYPIHLHAAEKAIAWHLRRLRDAPGAKSETAAPIHPDLGAVTLSEQQIGAVRMALENPVSLISGGPGTGKTTIIRKIVETAHEEDKHVALCAFTGRAARRMAESSLHEAQTIHRTLAYDPVTNKFQHNEKSPLAADIVICDESSMVEMSILAALVKAIPTGARFCLVGDVNQLPPVGPGAPFHDLFRSNLFPHTHLSQIFRQENDGLIISESQHVLEGHVPSFSKDPDKGDLFSFSAKSPEKLQQTVVELVTTRIPDRFGIAPGDIQVMSSVYKGPLGVHALNQVLQANIIGRTSKSKNDFYVGDKIIMTQNDYERGVMNGDMGEVVKTSKKEILVNFGGDEIEFGTADQRKLDLAYAISIHKSQGSEYQAGIVIAAETFGFNRNMLYTAMTRAKRLTCFVVPSRKGLENVVKKPMPARASRLVWRLKDGSIKPP